jgi:D-glycero-beta-D-manno-heptose 1-phosphate adenylyltransferase
MQPTESKILTLKEALNWRQQWKAQGEKVVFSNGCFDVLHLGHIDYLEKAKALGTKLLVALNTDASVKRLKGPERPLNNEKARGRMMAALAFVDAVIFFEEDTPLEVISTLKPDVLVKGSDYLSGNIIGAEIVKSHGGEVLTIQLVEGYSTTGLIQKIRNL